MMASRHQSEGRLDELDRRLVCALQHNGRASWNRIAAVLGVSERTIARRAARLLGSRLVRVVAVRNAFRLPGWSPLVLRVRSRPGRIHAVAGALARRPDVMWADIAGGGDEVCATVFARSPSRRNDLLLRELPATPSVTSWHAYPLMRVFAEGLRWNAGLLDDEEAAQLGTPSLGPVPGPVHAPDPIEERLAALLAANARMSFGELGTRAGISEPTARRRVSAMLGDGRLRVATEVDAALLGYEVEAAMWMSAHPGDLERIGAALAAHPATWFVGAATGPANLLAYVVLPDMDGLYAFLSTDVPKAISSETTVFLRAVKRAGLLC